uniref:Uncharacterized protein n=1 Tax=Anguilla anguilla TaxID=7936 RepID=A0A0E9TLH0_ANGAN
MSSFTDNYTHVTESESFRVSSPRVLKMVLTHEGHRLHQWVLLNVKRCGIRQKQIFIP